jgi:hypothetical protein
MAENDVKTYVNQLMADFTNEKSPVTGALREIDLVDL